MDHQAVKQTNSVQRKQSIDALEEENQFTLSPRVVDTFQKLCKATVETTKLKSVVSLLKIACAFAWYTSFNLHKLIFFLVFFYDYHQVKSQVSC